MFVFFIHLWNFGKSSIFLASAGSFYVKNDHFHTFFSLAWLQMLNLPAFLKNKNTLIGPFPWKWSVLQNPDRERTNQSTGICLGLGLPYNKYSYFKGPYYLWANLPLLPSLKVLLLLDNHPCPYGSWHLICLFWLVQLHLTETTITV